MGEYLSNLSILVLLKKINFNLKTNIPHATMSYPAQLCEVMTGPMPNYHSPATMEDLVEYMAERGVSPALVTHGVRITSRQFAEAGTVLDLSKLQLDEIKIESNIVHIGGQAVLQDLIESPHLQKIANGILPQACSFAAHLGLRHVSTLGGVILSTEGAAEIRLVLMALDASVVVLNTAINTLSLSEYRPRNGDVVLEVLINRWDENYHGALTRVARTPLDEAIVAVAALINPEGQRVAVSGVGEEPLFVSANATLTVEEVAEKVMAEARPVADYRGSAEYRRAMAGVLTKRALQAAHGRN